MLIPLIPADCNKQGYMLCETCADCAAKYECAYFGIKPLIVPSGKVGSVDAMDVPSLICGLCNNLNALFLKRVALCEPFGLCPYAELFDDAVLDAFSFHYNSYRIIFI